MVVRLLGRGTRIRPGRRRPRGAAGRVDRPRPRDAGRRLHLGRPGPGHRPARNRAGQPISSCWTPTDSLVDEGVVDETLATMLREAPCDVAVLAGPASVHRDAGSPVAVSLRRQRERLGGAGGRSLDRARAGDVALGWSERRPTASAAGVTRAGSSPRSRWSSRRSSGSSPSRCSSSPGRKGWSTPPTTARCSSSVSPDAGKAKASARRGSRSSRRACRPCSSAAACDRACSPRRRHDALHLDDRGGR